MDVNYNTARNDFRRRVSKQSSLCPFTGDFCPRAKSTVLQSADEYNRYPRLRAERGNDFYEVALAGKHKFPTYRIYEDSVSLLHAWFQQKDLEENVDAYYMVLNGPMHGEVNTKEFTDMAQQLYCLGMRVYA